MGKGVPNRKGMWKREKKGKKGGTGIDGHCKEKSSLSVKVIQIKISSKKKNKGEEWKVFYLALLNRWKKSEEKRLRWGSWDHPGRL